MIVENEIVWKTIRFGKPTNTGPAITIAVKCVHLGKYLVTYAACSPADTFSRKVARFLITKRFESFELCVKRGKVWVLELCGPSLGEMSRSFILNKALYSFVERESKGLIKIFWYRIILARETKY